MSMAELFRYTNPAERELRDREYLKKIFPLGLQQRDLALAALRPLIKPKVRDEELLYTFIATKQKFVDYSEQKARAYLEGQKYFSDGEKKHIMALVLLDAKVTTLEEYPATADVEEAGAEDRG